MAPVLNRIDHIHVYVPDRAAAEIWYREVLGLHRAPEFDSVATPGGPLILSNPSGAIELALFERPSQPCRSVIAFNVAAVEFLHWQSHLTGALGQKPQAIDHDLAWSLYFTDPYGNPYEITSYDYKALAETLRP